MHTEGQSGSFFSFFLSPLHSAISCLGLKFEPPCSSCLAPKIKRGIFSDRSQIERCRSIVIERGRKATRSWSSPRDIGFLIASKSTGIHLLRWLPNWTDESRSKRSGTGLFSMLSWLASNYKLTELKHGRFPKLRRIEFFHRMIFEIMNFDDVGGRLTKSYCDK